MSEHNSELEGELEEELRRVLDPVSAHAIPPLRLGSGRTRARAVLGGAGAALTVKLMSGVVVAAAAVSIAGTAATGSPNPAVWGQQVSDYVSACKDKLADGQHGIGSCVAPFASSHGSAVASAARQHGNGQGQGQGAGSQNAHGNNPNANDHAKDKGTKSHPTPGSGAATQGEPVDPATHPQVTRPAPR
jgi:hypothetical protein